MEIDIEEVKNRRALAVWLGLCALSVLIMALIGAITRLTESGLSIVEWKPLTGVLPPFSTAEWLQQFTLYQASPEYRLHNLGMSLADFRQIFFWEWLHRTWAHLIGVIFLLPFLFFFFTKRIPRWLWPRLLGLFALGGLQGLIGWYMVASGLVDRPSVSHYRLALHLGTAFLIYAVMLWQVFALVIPKIGDINGLRKTSWRILPLLLITMVWGAFVAGLHAGTVYNTFPLMANEILPPEAFTIQPVWLNFTMNTALVQFMHRWLAIGTAFAIFAFAWKLECYDRRVARLLGAAVLLQVVLGISTLLSGAEIALATLHQLGAITVLSCYLLALYRLSASKV